jgi:hypothetical protein
MVSFESANVEIREWLLEVFNEWELYGHGDVVRWTEEGIMWRNLAITGRFS